MNPRQPFFLRISSHGRNLVKSGKMKNLSIRVEECNNNKKHLGQMIKEVFIGKKRYYCSHCGQYDLDYSPKN